VLSDWPINWLTPESFGRIIRATSKGKREACLKRKPSELQIPSPAKTMKFLSCLLVCLSLPHAASAWNSQGHQVVAQIAYNHLDPEVKAKCDSLIALAVPCGSVSHTFVSDSTWADQRCDSTTSTQHYLDIPIALGTCSVENVVYDSINVVTAIQQEIATLQNPNATLSSQATALRYLIHFVGDIQQPLHCSTGVTCSQLTGDAGGNGFSLDSGKNLHSFWDSGGGYLADGMSVSSKAAAVEAVYPYTKSIGIIPDPMDWATESHDVAQTNTYVGVTSGSPASASYSNKTHIATEWRMAMGGQRLAKLLNTIFVTNVPVVATANIASDNFGFSWSSVSGRTYRVQWKQQLTDPSWTDLTDVTATTNSTSFSESTTGNDQRLYRAIVVN
jgi:hypothetical protein